MEWIVKPRSTPGEGSGGSCTAKGCGVKSCGYVYASCVVKDSCVVYW